MMGVMYVANLFLGNTNTAAVQSVVAIERTVFFRERAAGMYSALPYALAQVKKIIERKKKKNNTVTFSKNNLHLYLMPCRWL